MMLEHYPTVLTTENQDRNFWPERTRAEEDLMRSWVSEVTSEGSVPDQRDEGCSPSHRDNVSSSGKQGQHSSGVMDESSKRRIFIRPETRSLGSLLYNTHVLTRP
ncbi:uncharacterized protein ARMOST_20274 [Armillaria ostoyae]|uniref:Uncharacterized protein n=1 Tax=Armillaria ostoyae TaxID=47428 RepID=A0A284S6W7_ARMOS|nr:uncharacterized protein ARMOST_20274 [Armillaria ostoyae]